MENKYYKWLVSFIDPKGLMGSGTQAMIRDLYNTDFRTKRGFEDDKNRALDGTYLRVIFAEEHKKYTELEEPNRIGCYADIDLWIGIPGKACSCLEMLVGLARRIESEFYGSEDGVANCFWYFIRNIGIDISDDIQTVNAKIKKWIDREYEADGTGGLFVTNRSYIDMRECTIWQQLNIVLVENNEVLW